MAGILLLVGAFASGQELPPAKVDGVKTELAKLTASQKEFVGDKLTPEQKQALNKIVDGNDFGDEFIDTYFVSKPEKEFSHEAAPKLYLGKYGDIKAAKVTNMGSNGKGGYTYTVEVPDKRYIENGNVFRYIAKNNQKLDNTTIQFTHNGSPMAPKTITYK